MVKSARLQLPCEEGSWAEVGKLYDLTSEVNLLRQFVEFQYQSEMLWGDEELHSPRFWYEQGGFDGRRTGPFGDDYTWTRPKRKPRVTGKAAIVEYGCWNRN